jgi:hypothetical protein
MVTRTVYFTWQCVIRYHNQCISPGFMLVRFLCPRPLLARWKALVVVRYDTLSGGTVWHILTHDHVGNEYKISTICSLHTEPNIPQKPTHYLRYRISSWDVLTIWCGWQRRMQPKDRASEERHNSFCPIQKQYRDVHAEERFPYRGDMLIYFLLGISKWP